MESEDFDITYLPVQKSGLIDLKVRSFFHFEPIKIMYQFVFCLIAEIRLYGIVLVNFILKCLSLFGGMLSVICFGFIIMLFFKMK